MTNNTLCILKLPNLHFLQPISNRIQTHINISSHIHRLWFLSALIYNLGCMRLWTVRSWRKVVESEWVFWTGFWQGLADYYGLSFWRGWNGVGVIERMGLLILDVWGWEYSGVIWVVRVWIIKVVLLLLILMLVLWIGVILVVRLYAWWWLATCLTASYYLYLTKNYRENELLVIISPALFMRIRTISWDLFF